MHWFHDTSPFCQWNQMQLRLMACVSKKSGTIHPHSTNQPLSLDHLITVHSSTAACSPLGLSMMIALTWPQVSLLCFVKRLPFLFIHTRPCEETPLAKAMTHLHNRSLLPCLSFMYKYNSSTGVGGNHFFSPLQRDVTFGVCGLMRENKSRWRGAFSQREDFLHQQRKKRRKPWYSWLCRGNYAA